MSAWPIGFLRFTGRRGSRRVCQLSDLVALFGFVGSDGRSSCSSCPRGIRCYEYRRHAIGGCSRVGAMSVVHRSRTAPEERPGVINGSRGLPSGFDHPHGPDWHWLALPPSFSFSSCLTTKSSSGTESGQSSSTTLTGSPP